MSRKSSRFMFQVGVPTIAGFFYYYFLRPQMLKFGTNLGESQRRLPGDEIIVSPGYQATRAVNIDAPPVRGQKLA